jgi:hypothetical protein
MHFLSLPDALHSKVPNLTLCGQPPRRLKIPAQGVTVEQNGANVQKILASSTCMQNFSQIGLQVKTLQLLRFFVFFGQKTCFFAIFSRKTKPISTSVVPFDRALIYLSNGTTFIQIGCTVKKLFSKNLIFDPKLMTSSH